jgi:Omp85 superfamily domain
MNRGRCPSHVALGLQLVWIATAVLATLPWSDAVAQLTEPSDTPVPAPGTGMTRWFNPSSAPFIPIPSIGVDPNSGTTVGILPTWVHTDDQHQISRIIAPDLLHNPYFGWGGHARIYAYPSEDEQWSVVAGIMQRVQRGLDAEYDDGRSRLQRWSISGSLIFDRDGSPRFFGISNRSTLRAQTNYTDQQELAQAQIGLNLNHTWQLLYTGRARAVDVTAGTLKGIPSIEHRFARALGLGTNSELLHRLSIVYDTRNDLTVPTRGTKWVVYAGMASRSGVFNDSLYSEAGIDGRAFWPIATDSVLAAHMSLRYLPTAHRVPFWALSSIGGDVSVTGGEQPLRGFGEGRYYDRDSFSTSVELRHRVWSFNAVSTVVDLELAPFVDLGRVFARSDTFPLSQLHAVAGMGFRGVARPFVVGYVDLGYGSDGLAVFTGINYPF